MGHIGRFSGLRSSFAYQPAGHPSSEQRRRFRILSNVCFASSPKIWYIICGNNLSHGIETKKNPTSTLSPQALGKPPSPTSRRFGTILHCSRELKRKEEGRKKISLNLTRSTDELNRTCADGSQKTFCRLSLGDQFLYVLVFFPFCVLVDMVAWAFCIRLNEWWLCTVYVC